ncbi:TRAF family member-associated NF-kappa-B activator-like isoform X1 [Aquarana catesbeiana]|uniref:TRAF family member-associated NF-kappa-B activator-like isoform X1 n=1 Tax=Aquarana catesbeiana TaxID=8400 RepID=UPI003CC9DF57
MALAMERAFFELYQQFKVLQAVCSRQAELLQRLLSKDAHTAEKPMSKPIQCSDAADPICSKSPFLRQTGMEALSIETAKTITEELYQPLESEDKSTFSFDCDVQFPTNKDQYPFLASQGDKSGLATYMSNIDVSLDETEINGNFALFIKTYAPTFPKVPGAGEKSIPAMSEINFLPMDSNPILNIDEEMCFLQSKELSKGVILEPQINNFSEIKGPAQSSWHPDCLSEECHLNHHDDNISDVGLSSQICEFCQAVFPAGAATEVEYLQHITGHVE